MEIREQTQSNVRKLVKDIIQFNKLKNRKYQDICFDIQKTYGIDDYVDLLWNLDKMCNMLADKEEDINELSDTELTEVEQKLLSTAQFIGLNEYGNYSETKYSIIEADASLGDLFNFYFNPLEFIKSFIPNFIPQLPFSWWSPQLQLDYIRERYREGMNAAGNWRGTIAAGLRSLRSSMRLDALLSIAPNFMNIELRNFMNTNTNGSDCYEWGEVQEKPWREVTSLGALEHQRTSPDTKVIIFTLPVYLPEQMRTYHIPIPAYNRLNAKFCHPDGREVVFSYVSQDRGKFVDNIFDKGTYNYANDHGSDIVMGLNSLTPFSTHQKYDMKPFDKWFKDLEKQDNCAEEIKRLLSENGDRKCNLIPTFGGNSEFWSYN